MLTQLTREETQCESRTLQSDVVFGKKLAEQGEVILGQHKELSELKDTNTALAGLLKKAQDRITAQDDEIAQLKKAQEIRQAEPAEIIKKQPPESDAA